MKYFIVMTWFAALPYCLIDSGVYSHYVVQINIRDKIFKITLPIYYKFSNGGETWKIVPIWSKIYKHEFCGLWIPNQRLKIKKIWTQNREFQMVLICITNLICEFLVKFCKRWTMAWRKFQIVPSQIFKIQNYWFNMLNKFKN